VTAEVREALAELSGLAPLHNPSSLEAIDAALVELPEVPHVAVFDTAFHATLAPEAFTYPLPMEWTEGLGLRRFGFHGLSHSYSAGRAVELLGRGAEGLRLVIAHLGNGASVTAVANGRSVDTTMGFTPMEGLMMGTRSGSVDPGLLLHLLLACGFSAATLDQGLNHASGLVGVSGVSSDLRQVAEASRSGNPRATLALAIFAHRARQAVGAMAVTAGGVDALVFTGGIGEHSVEMRAAVCSGLSCLGLELDASLNAAARPDAVVSSPGSPGAILVVEAREDITMARAAAACLGESLHGAARASAAGKG
jgi:acetate kinase